MNFRNRLRQRLLGRRFQQQIVDAHAALKNLGNQIYRTGEHTLLAPGFVPPINAYEFSVYSQNGEDGVLLSLLSRIGAETRYMVEIGTEDGRECNSANLILNFGWRACLFEASKGSSDAAREYFTGCLGADSDRVRLINATVSPDNINQLLQSNDVPTHIDVLSIDIDSYEYWVWQAIEKVIPVLVVIEYNASFGPDRAVTIPYGSQEKPPSRKFEYYHGASLTALERLGKRKGYVLLGCESKGVNAFFVRSDLAEKAGLEAVLPAQAFRSHSERTKAHTQEAQCRMLSDAELDEV